MYKSTDSLAPECLSEIFVQNSVLTTMRQRNTEADVRVPLFKTSNGQNSISFRGLNCWGYLRAQVDEAADITSGTMNAGVVCKFCRYGCVMSLFS